jgi:hypothetical protein
MDHQEILEQLKKIINKKDMLSYGPTSNEGRKWLEKATALIQSYDPQRAAQFQYWVQVASLDLSSYTANPILSDMYLMIEGIIAELEAKTPDIHKVE